MSKPTLSPSSVRRKAHSLNDTINWGLEFESAKKIFKIEGKKKIKKKKSEM